MKIFSGIQPTGILHIGNYLGAIKNWKTLLVENSTDDFIFSIVDLHAITIFQEPKALHDSILSTFATYLACGIEGENVKVFQQSMVKEHCELAWILSCNLQIGFLERMTQYKEKTTQHKERACLGLYSYPVLMAADILLYKTNIVPVGEDQVQHIELTRDVAEKFNAKYGNIFTIPQARLTQTKRIMSLRDGSKKMSKSEESDLSRINLLDSPELITQKIKKAKTGEAGSPEIKNLIDIYEAFAGVKSTHDISNNSSLFKTELSDAIISELVPIQKRYAELMQDKGYLLDILRKNGEEVSVIAAENLQKIYTAIGLR